MLADHRLSLGENQSSPKKMIVDKEKNMIDLETKNLIEKLA